MDGLVKALMYAIYGIIYFTIESGAEVLSLETIPKPYQTGLNS